MKNIKLYLFAGIILLASQCTPKVGEELQKDATTEITTTSEDWRAMTPNPGPARKVQLGEYNVFDMDNGLKVIVVENHKLPRVSYQISLDNNPVIEGKQKGYVDFTGSLISRGTNTRTKAEIDKSIDQIGASMSSSASGIFGSSLTKHQDKVLEVMSDVLLNPSFLKEEFDKVKTQTLSGLQSAKDDPNSIAANVAGKVNYGTSHPYGEVQTVETTNQIELSKCKEYYNTYFKPNNAYLTIVGDITLAEAKANAEKYFGAWRKKEVPVNNYELPLRPMKPSVAFANKDGAVQSVISVTYPIDLKPGTDEALQASLMNAILGGGVFLGRLMQNLREDKAYTYGARSSVRTDRLVGRFSAGASVRNEVTDSSIVEVLYEMDRMANEPVSAEDLQLAKNSMAGSFARSLESPQNLARYARKIVRYNLPNDYYSNYLEKLDAVTVEDVQNIARKYVTKENANIVVVGNKDEISDKLVRFDGDAAIDYFDAFGNKLEIAETTLPDDIDARTVVQKYIDRVGGTDKWNQMTSMELHYGMEIMGMATNVDIYKKKPGKAALSIGNENMMFQEQIFDGITAYEKQPGGAQKYTEGPKYDQAKALTRMLKHCDYFNSDYKMELKGLDNAVGESCYKILVEDPNGNKSTEYFSVISGLLVKEVSTQEAAPDQVVTITQEFTDYKEYEGIPMATKISTSGMGPVPFVMELKEAKFNVEIDDAKFIIK